MSRLVHRTISVMLENDEPHVIVEGDVRHMVEAIIDRWEEAGRWFEGEPSHHIYRVVTSEMYMYDIERVAEDWFIYRVWD